MNSYRWEYDTERQEIFAPDLEDGLVVATLEPYDDADDMGRLMAAAPEMYELLKIWTTLRVQPTLMEAQARARELIARIEVEHDEECCD